MHRIKSKLPEIRILHANVFLAKPAIRYQNPKAITIESDLIHSGLPFLCRLAMSGNLENLTIKFWAKMSSAVGLNLAAPPPPTAATTPSPEPSATTTSSPSFRIAHEVLSANGKEINSSGNGDNVAEGKDFIFSFLTTFVRLRWKNKEMFKCRVSREFLPETSSFCLCENNYFLWKE